ncbi:MAG: sulfite exporter TauE/SafE family protein [Bdellovibrionota bacterium]
MSTAQIAILLAIGLASGLMGGLLGIGGGVIIVPVLVELLPRFGAPPEEVMHLTVATSLAAVLLTSISSSRAHAKKGNVVRRLVMYAGPMAAFGGIGGAWIAKYLPGEWHKRGFGLFLIAVAIQLLKPEKKNGGEAPSKAPEPHEIPIPGALAAGIAIGIAAGVLGIGGGSLAVPIFHLLLGLPIHQSVGTSAAVGVFAALLGTITHMLVPAGKEAIPYAIGYVHWPSALIISVSAVLTAQLGARLAAKTKPGPLRRIFGGFLLFVAARLLF